MNSRRLIGSPCGRRKQLITSPKQRVICDRRNSAADVGFGVRTGLMQRIKIGGLFDDLVGCGKHPGRYADAKGPGGLEIDDEIELGRQLYR
jgi:hypothetical protein